VEGDVTSAIALEHLNPALGEEFRRGKNVFRLRVAAEGDDGCVFEKKNDVADSAFFAESD
jgi:hypothetical protein